MLDASMRSAFDLSRAHTPVTLSAHIGELTGGKIVLKAENLQRTGVFKTRGTLNKVTRLGTAARNGVVAGSVGRQRST